MTWTDGINVALVEYLGESHVHPHGYSKDVFDPYVRTSNKTMTTIVTKAKTSSTTVVYDELVAYLDLDEAPRNSCVVKNKKHNDQLPAKCRK